ncbi:MAG: 50S ribosomal protein L3 [Bacilli bacterium]|nr:50S ribosomal protein L3 [Bacilli bacterium]
MKQIVGRKMGMTEVFAKDGTMYAVTVIEVLPNVVTQVKTLEKDGYAALQVGFEEKKESKVNGPERGHFAKANVKATKVLAEIKGDELASYNVGDKVTADIFQAGDVVDVIGTSKGRGYAGTIKRWGHKIGPKGHGSGYHRGQGSFANNGRNNARVIPGKKMSGHHGNLSATILNLKVVEVNAEKNYILIKGAVPGPKKSLVTIRTAIKAQLGTKEVIKGLVDLEAEARAAAEAKAAAEATKKAEEEAARQAALEAKAAEEAAKKAAEEAKKAEAAAEVAPEATPVSEEKKGE